MSILPHTPFSDLIKKMPSLLRDILSFYSAQTHDESILQGLFTSFIGTFAAVVGNTMKVALGTVDYTESADDEKPEVFWVFPNMYTFLIAESGDRKSTYSSPFSTIVSSIKSDKDYLRSEYYNNINQKLEAHKKSFPLLFKKASTTHNPVWGSRHTIPEFKINPANYGVPENPEFTLDMLNFNVASIQASAAQESYGNSYLYKDELRGTFDDLEKSGQDGLLDVLNDSYEYRNLIYSVKRKTKDYKIPDIYNYCTNLMGTLQYAGLQRFLKNYVQKDRGHGFLSRFQNVADVRRAPGSPRISTFINSKLSKKIHELFLSYINNRINRENLLFRNFYYGETENFHFSKKRIPYLHLTKEAAVFFNSLDDFYSKEKYNNKVMQEYIAKTRSHTLRLAGLLHCLEKETLLPGNPDFGLISLDTLKLAHELTKKQVSITETLYEYNIPTCSTLTSFAADLKSFMLNERITFSSKYLKQGFTTRVVEKTGWKILPRDYNRKVLTTFIEEALDYWVEEGFLEKEERTPSNTKLKINWYFLKENKPSVPTDPNNNNPPKGETNNGHTRISILPTKNGQTNSSDKGTHRSTENQEEIDLHLEPKEHTDDDTRNRPPPSSDPDQQLNRADELPCESPLQSVQRRPEPYPRETRSYEQEANCFRGAANSFESRRLPIGAYLQSQDILPDDRGKYLCPFHDDHNPSFSIYGNDLGVEKYKCFSCGAHGDYFDLREHLEGLTLSDQVRAEPLILEAETKAVPKLKKLKNTAIEATALWESPQTLKGSKATPLRKYLIQNRLAFTEVPIPDDLGFNGENGKLQMLAAIRGPTGALQALQSTLLDYSLYDTYKVASKKVTTFIGSPKGGTVCINKGTDPSSTILGEGTETLHSVLAFGSYGGITTRDKTILAALTAGNLKEITLPPEIRTVYLFMDNDAAGKKAAAAAKARFESEGRIVHILYPYIGKDFNDAFRAFKKNPVDVNVTAEYSLVESLPVFDKGAVLALDTETTGLRPYAGDRITLLQLATEGLPVSILKTDQTPLETRLKGLTEGVSLVAHNALFDMAMLKVSGMDGTMDCTMIADRFLTGRKKGGLAVLAMDYLRKYIPKDMQTDDWSGELTEEHLKYAAIDAKITLELWQVLKQRLLDTGQYGVYQLYKEAFPVLRDMWLKGCPIDREALEVFYNQVSGEIETLIRSKPEGAPNHRPSGSLQTWLKENIQGEGWPLTDTGLYDVSKDKLETYGHLLKEEARAFWGRFILPLRKLEKIKSVILELKEYTLPDTARVHTTLKILGAATGRYSSIKPNLQNLPKESSFRSLIKAPKGRKLLIADYSQIELRVAAHVMNIPELLEAYRHGADVHRLTASKILKIPLEEVTDGMRQLAKAVNFGLLYGQGAKGLQAYATNSYGVTMTLEEAETHREAFFKSYPEIAAFHKAIRMKLQKSIEATLRTPMGYQRSFKDAKNPYKFYLNSAYNHPIQGGAAEVMTAALVYLKETLTGLDAFPVLMVHDELLVEVGEKDVGEAAKGLLEAMCQGMSRVFPEASLKGLVDVYNCNVWSDKGKKEFKVDTG